MPAVTQKSEDDVVIYGYVKNLAGAPVVARVVITPVIDPAIKTTTFRNESLILDTDAKGYWDIAFKGNANTLLLVSVDGRRYDVRVPSQGGRYEFSTLIVE